MGAERLLNVGSAYPICYNWDFLRQEKTAVCGESLQHNGLKRELEKLAGCRDVPHVEEAYAIVTTSSREVDLRSSMSPPRRAVRHDVDSVCSMEAGDDAPLSPTFG